MENAAPSILHTWSEDYAASLLRDAGYRVEHGEERISKPFKPRVKRYFLIVKHPFNSRERYEFDSHNGRVYSEDIRALLDNPPMLGGMRVKQEQTDDFTFH